MPCPTFPENFNKIRQQLFELSCQDSFRIPDFQGFLPDFSGFLPDYPKIESLLLFAMADISWKFQQDPSITFWVILPGFLPDSGFSTIPSGFFRIPSGLLQHWITSTFCHARHFLKISARSVHNFLSYLAYPMGLFISDPDSKWSRIEESFRITLKNDSLVVFAIPDIACEFQKDPSITYYWVVLLLLTQWTFWIWPGFKVIQDQGIHPDHAQNFITSSFSNFRHSLKISERSIRNFLSYLANTQQDRQTDKLRQKHNLLGGGNNWRNINVIGLDVVVSWGYFEVPIWGLVASPLPLNFKM